jgi:hypothetical protein
MTCSFVLCEKGNCGATATVPGSDLRAWRRTDANTCVEFLAAGFLVGGDKNFCDESFDTRWRGVFGGALFERID